MPEETKRGDKEAPKRILTGDRPTGRLHSGHWVGSLRNGLIDEIVYHGTLKMRQIAAETMGEVRQIMGIERAWKAFQGGG